MARKIFPDDPPQRPQALTSNPISAERITVARGQVGIFDNIRGANALSPKDCTVPGQRHGFTGSTVDDQPVNLQQVRGIWSPPSMVSSARLSAAPVSVHDENTASQKPKRSASGTISTPTIVAAKALLRPVGDEPLSVCLSVCLSV